MIWNGSQVDGETGALSRLRTIAMASSQTSFRRGARLFPPFVGTLAIRGMNLFARAALTMATEKPQRMTPAVKAGLLAPYDSWANRVAIDRFVRDIPTRPSQPTWQRLAMIENKLPSLGVPVQLIWGMRDWCFTPECLERLLRSFPNAEVHRFADAGQRACCPSIAIRAESFSSILRTLIFPRRRSAR